MALTANANALLTEARRISNARACTFTGTEHFLAALLEPAFSETAIIKWLLNPQQGGSTSLLSSLRDETAKYVALTAGSSLDSSIGRSPGLQRSLQIATELFAPAGSEHVFLGILLAPHLDGVPSAACSSLRRAGLDADTLLESLLSALSVPRARLESIPRRSVVELGLHHDGAPVEAAEGGAATKRGAQPVRDAIANTHWAMDNVLCGASAGGMKQAALKDIVLAGVSTFVCLQTSYTEYGCRDYRETLRSMAASEPEFPPRTIRFLHAPIPDFGVLSDASLLALITELKMLLERGETLYVHCMGGHGRTGTVLTNLISSVEGVPAAEALRRLCLRHRARGCRSCALTHGELEAEVQQEQAERVKGLMKRGNALG